MPLNVRDLDSVKQRVEAMLTDTVKTFELMENNANFLFGRNSESIKLAINECLNDFLRNTKNSRETNLVKLIQETPPGKLSKGWFLRCPA